jgi:peptidyl-tRNA hydrolase, PTH1 family
MKLVAGLGNPGSQYRGTRHNVGFEVRDELARRHGLAFAAGRVDALVARLRQPVDAWLVKPLTFMNLSGRAVAELRRFYQIEVPDLLVVTDDVNLPLGRLRARPRGTDGGHNGLRSIVESLGTTEVARLRIGVGRGDARRDLADHVLARFDPDEATAIQAAIARGADAVERFLVEGIEPVMNAFNPDPATARPAGEDGRTTDDAETDD